MPETEKLFRTHPHFLSIEERQMLIDFYNQSTEKWQKTTGPLTLDLNFLVASDIYKNFLRDRLAQCVGSFDVLGGNFFYTEKPHIIHNDGVYHNMDARTQVLLLPLQLFGEETSGESPSLILFDQKFRKFPAKFFKGEDSMESPYNQPLFSYDDIEGLRTEANPISKDLLENHLPHLKVQWLEGLSVGAIVPWRLGALIVFEAQRLHCSGDFRRQGYHSKLGLSLIVAPSK